MYDYSKLKGRIVEKYGTQDKFAQAIGTTPTTLSFKLNGKAEFSQSEIAKIVDVLSFKKSEIPAIFFTNQV